MTPLHPRHRIDIGLRDLRFALAACARDEDSDRARAALESACEQPHEMLATHSVRSAFDLLLGALALPANSEVMLSALTIPDMARIVRAHGLRPIPVDLDPDTLAPTTATLERAYSPRARVLVVAQLFGAQVDATACARFASERGLLLVDDNAQGFCGPESLSRPSPATVIFHSFGTIKTATALGGALTRVRDRALLDRMRAQHQQWPVHPTSAYAKKVSQYAALLVPREPAVYRWFGAACDRLGPGLDRVVMSMTKGFPAHSDEELLRALRRRPCGATMALLHRRCTGFSQADRDRLRARADAGEAISRAIAPRARLLGGAMPHRTHWLVAPLLQTPERAIAPLRAAGFDAARGTTSITAIPAPADRPDLEPAIARAAMDRVLFVPAYPEIPEADRARLGEALCALA